MEPPDVIEWDDGPFYEELELMYVVTDLIEGCTNKAHLLMVLKKYQGEDETSRKVCNLINTRLKQLSGN